MNEEEQLNETSLFDDKYEIVGKAGFNEAKAALLELGIIPRFALRNKEILYQLTAAPTYEDVHSLAETLDSNIELGLLFEGKNWFLLRGFAAGGKDISAKFQGSLPENGIFIHTHPNDKSNFAEPSFIDVAHANKKSTNCAVIGGKGITEYTGIKEIKSMPDKSPENPFWLMAYFHDEVPYKTPLSEYQTIMQSMGMEKKEIPWGKEAQDHWGRITASIYKKH